jgi:hypothetical protein
VLRGVTLQSVATVLLAHMGGSKRSKDRILDAYSAVDAAEGWLVRHPNLDMATALLAHRGGSKRSKDRILDAYSAVDATEGWLVRHPNADAHWVLTPAGF